MVVPATACARGSSSDRPYGTCLNPCCRIYLVLLLDTCDIDLNWIRPTPTPPTAPASSPSSINMGTPSKSDLLFLNSLIPCSPLGTCSGSNFNLTLYCERIVQIMLVIPSRSPNIIDCDPSLSLSNRKPSITIPAEGVTMENVKGLASFVSELRSERTNLVDRLRHVDAALSVLGKLGGGRNSTRPKRGVSALARRRMSLAQKARWAKAKGRAPKAKRSMSASARRKIAAAQRARWAKIRAGKK